MNHVGGTGQNYDWPANWNVNFICGRDCLVSLRARVLNFPPPLMPGDLNRDRVGGGPTFHFLACDYAHEQHGK